MNTCTVSPFLPVVELAVACGCDEPEEDGEVLNLFRKSEKAF